MCVLARKTVITACCNSVDRLFSHHVNNVTKAQQGTFFIVFASILLFTSLVLSSLTHSPTGSLSLTNSLTPSLTHSLPRSRTPSLTHHSLTLKISLLHSHARTHTHIHTRTHALTLSLSLASVPSFLSAR